MTFLINPFQFVYGAVADWYVTFTDGGVDIADELAIHSSGTVTIPAGWNGRKVRASVGAIVAGGSDVAVSISLNGGSFDGRAHASFPNVSSTNEGGTAHTAPVVVSTGDTFTFSGGGGGDGSWRGVELLPNGLKGALVNRVTSAFNVGTAATVVQWNNEVYDTDGYHDNSTNPSRLTVPSGTTGLVRIQANILVGTALSQMGLGIKKNGSLIYQHESTNERLNVISPPITCAAGDYFEVEVYSNVATSVSVSGESWMSIEELDSSLQYAIASVTTGTLPTGAVWTQGTGSTESVDVGNWHASSKFTVPSGVTRIRCGFYGGSNTGLANAVEQAIFKNGSDFNLSPHSNQNSSGDEFRHACSPVIEVSPGDEFTFWFRTGAGSQTGYGTFWIEEVPEVT